MDPQLLLLPLLRVGRLLLRISVPVVRDHDAMVLHRILNGVTIRVVRRGRMTNESLHDQLLQPLQVIRHLHVVVLLRRLDSQLQLPLDGLPPRLPVPLVHHVLWHEADHAVTARLEEVTHDLQSADAEEHSLSMEHRDVLRVEHDEETRVQRARRHGSELIATIRASASRFLRKIVGFVALRSFVDDSHARDVENVVERDEVLIDTFFV